MFDAHYFRSTLQKDVDALGGDPIVEVLLLNGHAHRVRAVLDAGDGHVTLETYPAKGDLGHDRPRFGDAKGAAAPDTFRTALSYESIAAVVLDPAPTQVRPRAGFGA
jgi:hypothetical protein